MKIFVTGGTGFLGRRVITKLNQLGHITVIATRRGHTLPEGRTIHWDARSLGSWTSELEECDAVVNLAGESLARKRWNPRFKDTLRSSRVDVTRLLVRACENSNVRTFVTASAVGYYGHCGEEIVTESHPASSDFLGRLCEDWESASADFRHRLIQMRIGIVLGRNGGALQELLRPFRWFVGGHLGSGRQFFPWIHIDDVVGGLIYLLESPHMSGAFNFSAPNPVRMSEFCARVGQLMGRPSWAHVPSPVLRILVGEFAMALLNGQRSVPKRLLESGYQFQYAEVDAALRNLLTR